MSDSIGGALGAALLHFLWQGCLIGAVGAVALWLLRDRTAQARYLASCVTLFAMPAAFVATVGVLISPEPSGGFAAPVPASRSLMPAVAWAWLAGTAVMGVRVGWQWLAVRRLRRDARADVDAAWLGEFEALVRELGIGRRVRLFRSRLAEAPMVVGWVRPIVLVPVTMFTSLTPEQVRAVLAHELAHIRRFDHLVNAIQSVIEVVLFFHPAVWWVSGRVRLERENCCDDIAVQVAGPVALARALSELETLRDTHPQMALSANGGTLMNRITRILGVRRPSRVPRWRSAAGVACALALGAAGLSHAASLAQPTHLSESLREAVKIGAITEQEARELYMAYLFPGSEKETKVDTQLAKVEAEIQAALEAGVITPEQAHQKRLAVEDRRTIAEDVAFAMDVKGESHDEAYLGVMALRIHTKMERGEITKEEAVRQIHDLKAKRVHQEKVHAYIKDMRVKLEVGVASGKLTEEEAEALLHSHLREIEAKAAAENARRLELLRDVDGTAVKTWIEAGDLHAAQQIDGSAVDVRDLIAARQLPPSDAQAWNEALRRSRQAAPHRSQQAVVDRSIIDLAAAYKGAVQAGDMSKAEAEAALLALLRQYEEEVAAKKAGGTAR